MLSRLVAPTGAVAAEMRRAIDAGEWLYHAALLDWLAQGRALFVCAGPGCTHMQPFAEAFCSAGCSEAYERMYLRRRTLVAA